MNKLAVLLVLIIGSALPGCLPYEEDELVDIQIDLRDSIYQKIYEFQDRQLTDSLFRYFQHKDPTYRYVSVMALASIRDSSAVDSLAIVLSDKNDEVRAAAAYALGQTGSSEAEPLLISAFDRYDTLGTYHKSNRAILEAVGKCGNASTLKMLSSISTYLPKDTALLEGQTLGIYRLALRNITSPEGTGRMVELAAGTEFPPSVRLIAANYLARARNISLEEHASTIIPLMAKESAPNIRMALVLALGKIQSEEARNALISRFSAETDFRVKCNILRALSNYDYEGGRETVFVALKDPNPHVSAVAAQYFLDKGIGQDATAYWQMAKDSLPWQSQITLYAAAQRHLPATSEYRDAINYELRQRAQRAVSSYEKAEAIRALSEFGWNFRFIRREGFPSKDPVVRTASVEALAAICQGPVFSKTFGAGARRVLAEFAGFFVEAIGTGDVGMVAAAAEALRNPGLNFKPFLQDLTVPEKTLAGLSPDNITERGAYHQLHQTLQFLKGEKAAAVPQWEYQHPVDWSILTGLNVEPTVLINTSKGVIKLKLLSKTAPATVANFIQLVRDDFYDGLAFHRVVPNFVIQGGCPRGDGTGGPEYSIRSELPLLYYHEEGSVGMASSGNHTEGSQFFITHSPAPHLDGNYTLFGRVVDGMDVVHKIQKGDLIQEIIIQ